MKIEKLRKSYKNKIIVGGLISLGVIGVISILPSFAKYRITDSINVAKGTVNYKVPDFKVMAMYQQSESGDYEEVTVMPTSGYAINEEKTYCTTDNVNQVKGKIKTINGIHSFTNLNKGDKCYLYFDELIFLAENTLEKLGITNINYTVPDFNQVATTNDGVYKTSDGMYGGNSYYWRGAVENNYVKFANFCWRIVRINGDGSIRLIYDGITCHANSVSTLENIAIEKQPYNKIREQSIYVGYTYVNGTQRPDDLVEATASNLKLQTEEWLNTSITEQNLIKIADGKFCNDREVAEGSIWELQPNSDFYFSGYGRLNNLMFPTLSCNNGDIYTLKVGAITADEISFAGSKIGSNNKSFYLYNGQSYWTMTPSYWNSTMARARVLILKDSGALGDSDVHNASNNLIGIRPVINLRPDIQIKEGTIGTLDNPYVVL